MEKPTPWQTEGQETTHSFNQDKECLVKGDKVSKETKGQCLLKTQHEGIHGDKLSGMERNEFSQPAHASGRKIPRKASQ